MKFFKSVALCAILALIISCNQPNADTSIANEAAEQKTNANKALDDKISETGNQNEAKTDPGLYKRDGQDKQEAPQKDIGKQTKQSPANQPAKSDWEKKIIKNGSLNLEVKDYNAFYISIREKLKGIGGYIAQEEQAQSDYKIENSMTIKVPVDQFDNAIVQLSANVQKINERKITSEDVTTEVVDTKSRMEARKQVRQRYMDLLGQAKNMADILSVQSEINSVQEEIESAAGRIDYLTHSSVFSTIHLTYYQVLNSSAKNTEETTKPSFGKKVSEAFKAGWEIITELFVAVVTIWPLLLASFFAFVAYKKLRRTKPVNTNKPAGV